jgi:hypothetical protein
MNKFKHEIFCDIVDNAFKQTMILYLSNVPDKEIIVKSYGNRDINTIEFPTLDRSHYICRYYWSSGERYQEEEHKGGKKILTSGWEIFEMYCGGKNGRKTKVKRRVF